MNHRSPCRGPRTRRSRLAASVAALLVAACGGAAAPAEGPRHVVLISLDTTRADHLGCYGNREVRTPALDALSREAVLFEDCTSAAATTLASHTSMMTGLVPRRHGVPRNGFVVDEGNELLAERLSAAGFHTAAFIGSAALVGRTGLSDGFAHYDESFDVAAGEGGADQSQRAADAVTAAALAHVDDVLGRDGADDARLFLFAHYFDPHAPYAPPASEVARYRPGLEEGGFAAIEAAVRQQQERAIGRALGQSRVINEGLSEGLLRGASGAPTEVGRALAKLYAGEVTALDRGVGALLAGLARRGLLDDALVVVTADHGETFWEHGNAWNHGLWVSQTDVHVPLIVRLPGARRAGARVEAPVSGVDVAPTIVDLLGLDPLAPDEPDVARGVSLAPAIDGAGVARRPIFAVATQPGGRVEAEAVALGPGAWRGARKPIAVRSGPWKLVDAPYLDLQMLFHLDRDPGEQQDLIAAGALDAEAAGALTALRADLARLRESTAPRPSEFDATQAKALLGLGYAESGPEGAGDTDDRDR